jgi:sugar phosphate isomerase/epimerase
MVMRIDLTPMRARSIAAHRSQVVSHFTLSRHHPLDDRIALVASAGFDGIGLYVGQYLQLVAEQGRSNVVAWLRDLLDQHGVALIELEVIPGLGRDGVGGDIAQQFEAAAFELADTFGCRAVQVIGPADMPVGQAAQAFGSLCDRAADHGLALNLEFLPFTDVFGVDDARRIVEAADRPNGGICVDIWHHERGSRDLAAIAALPGELITGIQFNDGTLAPVLDDYKADCLAHRVPPGHGQFDVDGFLGAVAHASADVPLSWEVCSTWGWANAAEHLVALGSELTSLRG